MSDKNEESKIEAINIIRKLKGNKYNYAEPISYHTLKEFGKVLIYLYDQINNLNNGLGILRSDFNNHNYDDGDAI
jgi:hypothetical protein